MVLSDALCLAARNGDVAAIQAWLEAGGDPDERTGPDTVDLHRPHEIGQTLLHWAVGREEYRAGELPADVENRRNDVVRMLLAHGATVDALPDARLLRPRLQGIFSLRALCHRGRAAPTLETPPAFTRLIGGSAPASRPRTRAAKVLASPGLPDPLAHHVCKFWLGEPPRRRTE